MCPCAVASGLTLATRPTTNEKSGRRHQRCKNINVDKVTAMSYGRKGAMSSEPAL